MGYSAGKTASSALWLPYEPSRLLEKSHDRTEADVYDVRPADRCPADLSGAAMTILDDDEPISLAEACNLFFRGRLTKSSLRTEARKGNLEIIQIANKDFVTKNGIKRMIEKCRKNADQPDYGSDRTAEHGSSRTEPSASAQNALRVRLQQRKQPSPSTSQSNTSHNAAVVQLKSR
jgi:hypothetical protein